MKRKIITVKCGKNSFNLLILLKVIQSSRGQADLAPTLQEMKNFSTYLARHHSKGSRGAQECGRLTGSIPSLRFGDRLMRPANLFLRIGGVFLFLLFLI